MIEVRNLEISRGDRQLFNGLNFSVKPGAGLRISGPNGIGKSSLLAAILGEIPLDSGCILINHINVSKFSDDELFKIFAVMSQSKQWTSLITVADLLDKLKFLNIKDSIFVELGIEKLFSVPIQKLSSGQLQRLFFAITFSKPADIYIFDEPISNQDEVGQRLIEAKIRNLVNLGKTVILVSHFGFEFLPSMEINQNSTGH